MTYKEYLRTRPILFIAAKSMNLTEFSGFLRTLTSVNISSCYGKKQDLLIWFVFSEIGKRAEVFHFSDSMVAKWHTELRAREHMLIDASVEEDRRKFKNPPMVRFLDARREAVRILKGKINITTNYANKRFIH